MNENKIVHNCIFLSASVLQFTKCKFQNKSKCWISMVTDVVNDVLLSIISNNHFYNWKMVSGIVEASRGLDHMWTYHWIHHHSQKKNWISANALVIPSLWLDPRLLFIYIGKILTSISFTHFQSLYKMKYSVHHKSHNSCIHDRTASYATLYTQDWSWSNPQPIQGTLTIPIQADACST
jgi:hypothetical protein